MSRKLAFAIACAMLLLACVASPTAIKVSEIGSCKDFDPATQAPIDIGDSFTSDSRKVVIYFKVETNVRTTVVARWFHENRSIAEYAIQLVQGYNISWIGLNEGQALPIGEYHVDIVLDDQITLRTTKFRVTPP